jgi:hypothetical protein
MTKKKIDKNGLCCVFGVYIQSSFQLYHNYQPGLLKEESPDMFLILITLLDENRTQIDFQNNF